MFVPLLNTSISASWLILAIIVIRLVFKRMPKAVTCVLWGLVAIRLICPFSIESSLSVIPSAEIIPEEVLYMEGVQLHDPVEFNGIEAPAIQETVGEVTGTTVSQLRGVDVVGTLIWGAGMAVMLLYALVSYLRLRHRVIVSINEQDNIWLCDQIDSPFILGMFRPRIYMPSGMAEEQATYVIAHEQAHLQRHDHWWKPFGFLLLSVYWFNPLIWVAYILLSRDIELACDEKVIRSMTTPDKQAYSEALLVCSVNRRMIAACPLAFGEVGVKERVKSVLNYKKPAFWVVVGSVVICAVVAVCFLTDPEDSAPDEMQETACEHVPGDFVSYEWRDAPNPDPAKYTVSEQRWDKYICTQCGEEFEVESWDRLIPGEKKEYPVTQFLSEKDFEDPVATAEKLLSRAFSFDPANYKSEVSQDSYAWNITFNWENHYIVRLEPELSYPPILYEFRRVPPGGYGEVEIPAEGELVDIAEDFLWNTYALKGEDAQIEVVQIEDKIRIQFVFSDTAIFQVQIDAGDLKPSGILFLNNLEAAQLAMKPEFSVTNRSIHGALQEDAKDDAMRRLGEVALHGTTFYDRNLAPSTVIFSNPDILSKIERIFASYQWEFVDAPQTEPEWTNLIELPPFVFYDKGGLVRCNASTDASIHWNASALNGAVWYRAPGMFEAMQEVTGTFFNDEPAQPPARPSRDVLGGTPLQITQSGITFENATTYLDNLMKGWESHGATTLGTSKVCIPDYSRENTHQSYLVVNDTICALPHPCVNASMDCAKLVNSHLDMNQWTYSYEAVVPETVRLPDSTVYHAGKYTYLVDLLDLTYQVSLVPADFSGQVLTTVQDELTYEERLAWAQVKPYYEGYTTLGRYKEGEGCIACLCIHLDGPLQGTEVFEFRFADGTVANLPLPPEGFEGGTMFMKFKDGKFIFEKKFSTEKWSDDKQTPVHLKGTYCYEVDLSTKTVSLTVLL